MSLVTKVSLFKETILEQLDIGMEGGGWEPDLLRVWISSYKMNSFWGSNAQHGAYNEQYCIRYQKVAKTGDLQCSHHKQGMAIM